MRLGLTASPALIEAGIEVAAAGAIGVTGERMIKS
jgi:hypothetical protein